MELTRRPSFPSQFFIRGYLIDPDKDDQFYVVEALDVRIVDKWFELARDVAKEKNVPHMWILAMIYAESRGNPSSEAPGGGWGLAQITHPGLKKGYSKPLRPRGRSFGFSLQRLPDGSLHEQTPMFRRG